MAASSKLMITEAERRFPCLIKVGVPSSGLGSLLTEIQAWLDENCGSDGCDDPRRATGRGQRCGRDLLPRHHVRSGIRGSVVRRIGSGGERRRVPGAR
jgi:hypothetical protein